MLNIAYSAVAKPRNVAKLSTISFDVYPIQSFKASPRNLRGLAVLREKGVI
jgi:hypothetical protein